MQTFKLTQAIKIIMKKLLLYSVLFSIFMFSCDQGKDPTFYDDVNGQTGLGFNGPPAISVTVPEAGITVDIPVQVTTVSTSDRSFNVSVDEEASTPNTSANYTLGSISIPAGDYEGNLAVTFNNFENLADFVTNTLVLNLSLPDGAVVIGSDTVALNYVKEFVCPDLVLNITFDTYPGETSWQIENEGGNVVASGTDYGGETSYSEDLCLPNGCYTFTIFDSFGDGICCNYGDGSYEILLDGVAVVTSDGVFGSEESKNFCVE